MTSVPPAIGTASGCSAFAASASSQVDGLQEVHASPLPVRRPARRRAAPCPRSARTAGRRRRTPRPGCPARTATGRPGSGACSAASAAPRRPRAARPARARAHRVQRLLQRVAVRLDERGHQRGAHRRRRRRPSRRVPSAACRQRASTAVASTRSVVSGSVVYSSLAKPWNSESVVLSSTRPVSPVTTWACRAVVGTPWRCGSRSPSRANECGPSRRQPYCSMRHPGVPDRRLGVDEVPGQPQPELLERADAVLAGERVHRVLLRVGRQHVALSPVRWRGVEVAGQRDGDGEVEQVVPVSAAARGASGPGRICRDDAHRVSALPYRLAPEHDRHAQLPR